jgi:hypothetical protein
VTEGGDRFECVNYPVFCRIDDFLKIEDERSQSPTTEDLKLNDKISEVGVH